MCWISTSPNSIIYSLPLNLISFFNVAADKESGYE